MFMTETDQRGCCYEMEWIGIHQHSGLVSESASFTETDPDPTGIRQEIPTLVTNETFVQNPNK